MSPSAPWQLESPCGTVPVMAPHQNNNAAPALDAAADFSATLAGQKFSTILADPPWQFTNRTGKVAPEHKRLNRYGTMDLPAIAALPVASVCATTAHLYLWVPNALLPEGLEILKAWGFTYKSNLIWHKIRKDGGPDGRGVGFYFRNVTEIILFGTRGKDARTLSRGRPFSEPLQAFSHLCNVDDLHLAGMNQMTYPPFSQFTIQGTPNRSTSIPNRTAQNVS